MPEARTRPGARTKKLFVRRSFHQRASRALTNGGGNRRRLLVEDFLDVADLLLDLAFHLFGSASVLQIWISNHLAGLFFHLTDGFLRRPLNLVFGARVHTKNSDFGERQSVSSAQFDFDFFSLGKNLKESN
jgi:hypothetical protein